MEFPNRRTALKTFALAGITLTMPDSSGPGIGQLNRKLNFGVIADLHGGFVRDAESRLDHFLEFTAAAKCDALIQLGDFAFPNQKHQKFADKFNSANDVAIHVIGNHEFDFGLTRKDCFKAWGLDSSYYVKDLAGLRIVVLDGNEQGSPSYTNGYYSFIGNAQFAWLEHQLKTTKKPILILSHQPLAGSWPVDNAQDVQNLLSDYKDKIMLCLNGHSHIDSLVTVKGVRYLHVNSASYFWVGGKHRTAFYQEPLFSLMAIDPEQGTISITGRTSNWKGKNPTEMGYFESKENPPPAAAVVPKIRSVELKR